MPPFCQLPLRSQDPSILLHFHSGWSNQIFRLKESHKHWECLLCAGTVLGSEAQHEQSTLLESLAGEMTIHNSDVIGYQGCNFYKENKPWKQGLGTAWAQGAAAAQVDGGTAVGGGGISAETWMERRSWPRSGLGKIWCKAPPRPCFGCVRAGQRLTWL